MLMKRWSVGTVSGRGCAECAVSSTHTLFPLFATRLATPSNAQYGYAVAPNGRFLMNVVGDESSASPITIVQNWTAGLKK